MVLRKKSNQYLKFQELMKEDEMTQDTVTKEWTKPLIKQIDLEFDKEMSDNCKGSAQASSTHKKCGIAAGEQSACWNFQTG